MCRDQRLPGVPVGRPREPSVRLARSADRDAWEALVAAHGSFLQSWRWGEFREALGWNALRLVAEQAGCVVGVMQALLRRFAPGVGMLYVPRGPACAEGAALRPLLVALGPLAREHRAWLARVEPELPESPDSAALCRSLGLRQSPVTVQLPHTVVVDLTPSPERVLAGFKPTWRRYVRHAPRRGVTVREGGAEDLATFYALERETAGRQGITGRPRSYYQRFFQRFAGAGAQLFLAELAGESLAAIITLERGRTATYLYGGSSRRHQEAHPNYLLQWTAMLHARASGCKRYDLWGCGAPGDPASREAGLTSFKSGFGPVVAHTGAWDLPASPLYPLWRRAELLRKTAVQTRAHRQGTRQGGETSDG